MAYLRRRLRSAWAAVGGIPGGGVDNLLIDDTNLDVLLIDDSNNDVLLVDDG